MLIDVFFMGLEAKCVTVYWELTFGKWDQLAGGSGLSGSSARMEEIRFSTRIC